VLFDPCGTIAPQSNTLPGASSFTYRKAKRRDLRLHVFAPAGEASPRPAALFFFGGAWRTGTSPRSRTRPVRLPRVAMWRCWPTTG